MTTQILFIRHGKTDWNRIKRIQGHIDIPLATTGLAQAQRLARRMADEAKQGARLDAIYSSDLQRAQQTAQPIADVLGLPLQLREDLRERSYGAFQGHDSDEIAVRFPMNSRTGKPAMRASHRRTASRNVRSTTACCTRLNRWSPRIRVGGLPASHMAACSIACDVLPAVCRSMRRVTTRC